MSLTSDAEVLKIVEAYDLQDKLSEELAEMGIVVRAKPSFDKIENVDVTEDGEPILPSDLTSLDLTSLGRYYSCCNAYLAFLSSALTLTDYELKKSKETKEVVWATVRQEMDGTKSDKDDFARVSPRFIQSNAFYMLKSTKYTLIKQRYVQFENNLRIISREFSRRQMEMDTIKTEGGLGYRGKTRDEGRGTWKKRS